MIHWNADPEVFSFGFLTIRWYGIVFAAAFLSGYHIIQWIYTREGIPVSGLDRLFVAMFAGTLIGARLGHCLFYDPGYYLTHPLDILKIWEGGLASHGGALGIITALWLYARKPGNPVLLWLLDRIVIPSALAGAMIRLGNFMNSEIVGIPTRGNWGVVFERVDMIPRHPVQVYEAFAYVLIFILLLSLYRWNVHRLRRGLLTGAFLVSVFSVRILLETVKTHQALFTPVFNLRVGQLLSIPFVLLGIALMVRSRIRN